MSKQDLGDCLVVKVGDKLRVDRADEHILISDELLEEWRSGTGHPDVTLDAHPAAVPRLEIRAVNGTFRYDIGGRDDDQRLAWHAYRVSEDQT